jgi:hypothetical protein
LSIWAAVDNNLEDLYEGMIKSSKRKADGLGSGNMEHPAAKAWGRFCSRSVKPAFIEVLLEGKKGNSES